MESLTLEDVLFNEGAENKLFVLPLFENEKPLQNSTGLMDWRFRGVISRWISEGKIQGKPNESVYLPVQTKYGYRHLLVLGLGSETQNAGAFKDRMQATVKLAKKLHFNTIVLSRSRVPQSFDANSAASTGVTIEVVA